MPLVYKQALAIIDSRTTVICLDVHGVVVPVDAPFETLAGDFQAPPFHVHCRTLVGPHMPGFISQARKAANTELVKRPMKERRKGPDGPAGSIPGPTTDNPPSGFSRRDDSLDLKQQDLLFANERKLKDAGKGAGAEHDPWGPTTTKVPEAPDGKRGPDASHAVAQSLTILPEDEAGELLGYQAGSGAMNKALRNGTADADMLDRVGRLDAALARQEPLGSAVVLHRGIPADVLPAGSLTGAMMKDKAFWSTTLKEEIGSTYAGVAQRPVLMELTVPAGERVLAANLGLTIKSRDMATGPNVDFLQSEVLLGRDTEIKFLGEPEERVVNGKSVLMVRAVVVPKPAPAASKAFEPTVVTKPKAPAAPLPMADAAAMFDKNPVLATRDERTAVGLYKAGMTWSQDLRQDKASEFTMERVNQVISINDRQVPITEPVALYRGMSSQFLPADLQPGMVFRDKGFTSTSLDRETAALFKGSGVLLEIVAAPGTKLLPVNHAMIEDQSRVPEEYRQPFNVLGSEAEILLMPGSEFEVVGKKKRLINGSLVEVLQVNLRPAEG